MERLMRAGMLVAAALSAGAAALAAQQPPNTLTPAQQAAGWTLLFDGRTTGGWHRYGHRDTEGWAVVDGALTRVGPGGDIVTDEIYRNFELALDWLATPGANSGILYRGIEAKDPDSTPLYYSAPEMQVLDDAGHADGASPLTSAGANYGLDPAPRGIVKPAGQWNSARILVIGNQVEHWLNGVKVVEYELGSPAWKAKVEASKFDAWPQYGTAAEGVIGLQDHGDRVAFRTIRIRRLP